MTSVHFGIQTPQEGATCDALAAHWREADVLGFDSVWLDDHFYSVLRPRSEPQMEAWTLLAALARETRRIGSASSSRATRTDPRAGREDGGDASTCSRTDASSTASAPAGSRRVRGLRLRVPRVASAWRSSTRRSSVQKLLWSEERATFGGRYYQVQARRGASRVRCGRRTRPS